MPKTENVRDLQRMAADIFELMKLAFTARARARADRPEELSEAEFLSLDALSRGGSPSVGDIQKQVGVLPAQMSRIIRALENKPSGAFVKCSINPGDRRKIDVQVTAKGKRAHTNDEAVRLKFAKEVICCLPVGDRELFMQYMSTIHQAIAKRLEGK